MTILPGSAAGAAALKNIYIYIHMHGVEMQRFPAHYPLKQIQGFKDAWANRYLYATSCTNETNLFEDWLNFIRASQRKSLPPAVHVVNLVFINIFNLLEPGLLKGLTGHI